MKKTVYTLLTGAFLGATILGGVEAAVESVSAQRSYMPMYVDGERVQLEAYAINGANYVKLRDVGKAVGFNVSWDGSAVQIDSDAPYQDEAATAQAGRIVSLPTDGSKYVPKAGDLIPCDDGTLYEVKDVTRWENNVFMDGPMPDMPTPSCDWSLFPELTLPKAEARHFQDSKGKEVLFVRNLYETRRMQYTLYNAIGNNPGSWRDGKPLAKVFLTIPDEYEPYTGYFWPWRESEITKHVENIPRGRFRVEAWDFYSAGIFQYTRYLICTI